MIGERCLKLYILMCRRESGKRAGSTMLHFHDCSTFHFPNSMSRWFPLKNSCPCKDSLLFPLRTSGKTWKYTTLKSSFDVKIKVQPPRPGESDSPLLKGPGFPLSRLDV